MTHRDSVLTVVLGAFVALCVPAASIAAETPDLALIRAEIAALRAEYDARLRALEKRLLEAVPVMSSSTSSMVMPSGAIAVEPGSTAAVPPATTAPGLPQPPVAASTGRFNPDLSVILSGRYARLSRDPTTRATTGFPTPEGVETGPGDRGLSLGETELGFSASIDPWMRGALRVALEPGGGIAVEEANLQTTRLGGGLSLKAGRFFSGIGYLNEQHPHYWDFIDAPLAWQAMLGRQFGDDGLQLRWLAPSDTFIELGAELGRGRGVPGTGAGNGGNGAGSAALFAHIGDDIGQNANWRGGLSWLQVESRDLQASSVDPSGRDYSDRFSGRNRFWVADAVWKWSPDGNPGRRGVKLQGEYLRRDRSGDLTRSWADAAAAGAYEARQSGWYLQAVLQLMPRWRVGVRTERLLQGSERIGGESPVPPVAGLDPRRHSLMIDFSPSEFSRFRLQLARDLSRPDGADNQLFLQYQTSLGAHGAHRY